MVDITALLKGSLSNLEQTSGTMKLLDGTIIKMFANPITPNDLSFVERKHPGWQSRPTIEGMVDIIIRKARDVNGETLFTLEHKPLLMRHPNEVVTEPFTELFGTQIVLDDEVAQDARKGKSKAIT